MSAYTIHISHILAEYFDEMSLMLLATLLVVYGDIINKHIKRTLSPYHFVVRCALFVVLCAFGYGALTVYGAPFLHYLFNYIAYEYRGLAFVVAFFALGLAAERRRYI